MTRFTILAALVALPSAVGAQAASPAQARTIDITLVEWKIKGVTDTIAAGPVTFRITNAGTISHAFYVLGGSVSEGTKEIAAKQTMVLRLDLKPGEYEIYCPLSDQSHKMAGMSRKLMVVSREAARSTR